MTISNGINWIFYVFWTNDRGLSIMTSLNMTSLVLCKSFFIFELIPWCSILVQSFLVIGPLTSKIQGGAMPQTERRPKDVKKAQYEGSSLICYFDEKRTSSNFFSWVLVNRSVQFTKKICILATIQKWTICKGLYWENDWQQYTENGARNMHSNYNQMKAYCESYPNQSKKEIISDRHFHRATDRVSECYLGILD